MFLIKTKLWIIILLSFATLDYAAVIHLYLSYIMNFKFSNVVNMNKTFIANEEEYLNKNRIF